MNMNGLLGSYTLVGGILQSIYVGKTTDGSSVTLNVCNRNNKPVSVRVAISDSLNSATTSEYIEYDVEIAAKGVLERTGIVIGLNQYLTIYSSNNNVTALCWGVEVGELQTVTPVTTNTDAVAPSWTTSATFDVYTGVYSSVQLAASDAAPLTYSLTSGSLPSGMSLGDNGLLFGTPTLTGYNASGVTTTATITASDGTNTTPRTFSITRKWYDGTTSSQFAESALAIQTINPSATNGMYWIRQTGSTAFQHYCVFTDFTGAAIQGGPWTVPMVFNRSPGEFSIYASSAFPYFRSLLASVGISTPGRGMENFRMQSEVYGAWLATKRALWNGYLNFFQGKSSGGGGVIAMPVMNINGEGGTSDHRTVYNTSFGTHLPPNIDGDAANSNQLFAGFWGATDVASWATNNNAIPGPEDWGPNDVTNTTYGYTGYLPMIVCGVYR